MKAHLPNCYECESCDWIPVWKCNSRALLKCQCCGRVQLSQSVAILPLIRRYELMTGRPVRSGPTYEE